MVAIEVTIAENSTYPWLGSWGHVSLDSGSKSIPNFSVIESPSLLVLRFVSTGAGRCGISQRSSTPPFSLLLPSLSLSLPRSGDIPAPSTDQLSGVSALAVFSIPV